MTADVDHYFDAPKMYESLEDAELELFTSVAEAGSAVSRLPSKKSRAGKFRKGFYQYVEESDYRQRSRSPQALFIARISASMKIGCPFRVTLTRVRTEGWVCSVSNSQHHHPKAASQAAYAVLRRVSDAEMASIRVMKQSGIAPVRILATLRQQNPDCRLIMRDIYNISAGIRREELGGRRPIEALLDDFVE